MLPIIIVGLLLNAFLLSNADEDFIFKNDILFLLALIFIALSAWIIYKDKKEFKKTKSRLSFLPTITVIIFISFFLITNIVLANRDISPNNNPGWL
ncbi:hypothetical protein [Parafilimonas sp.]|uniref:hypothetical protein n=1 Tax=Parafilimonas sp. TaxID=1969739 RepID=UPI0039E29BC6